MTTTVDPAVSDNAPNLNSSTKTDTLVSIVPDHQQSDNIQGNDSTDPIVICQVLRQQNDALRRELQDIRREMDEITDQFRTEDAEEFKQLQAELDVSAKTCRILQFKLRKAEKRNETIEAEKSAVEEKLHELTGNHRSVRNIDEELLIAKEVSVRLHSELEKSEQARHLTEKFNKTLKQQLDILKESLDQTSVDERHDDYYAWQLSVGLYEALLREYVLIEELTCLNAQINENPFNELILSYQEKIETLTDELTELKQNVHQRDQTEKISSPGDVSNENLQQLAKQINELVRVIHETRLDSKTIESFQQRFQTSNSYEISSNVSKQAEEFLQVFNNQQDLLEKIRQRLINLTSETNETSNLIEELDEKRKLSEEFRSKFKDYEEKYQNQLSINEKLEKIIEEEKAKSQQLTEENSRLVNLTNKQSQDLRHLEQLRQSIVIFEKKLDQKQTRVNELSMKIIEKEDIIETKVKECQKHRLELRELETKYYNLGKQLEDQIVGMSKEIEKLNVEKEMLKFDLESVRLSQQTEKAKSTAEEDIARVKNECRQQIIDGEVASLKLRLTQSNHEKEELSKSLKELERKYRDLSVRSEADEQSWTRMKNEMMEKQRKYDESIKFKSELQNGVDRLRQKLHDVEMHSQDKQNKFNADKQQWENQRLEWIGKVNELEEQLSKVTKRQRKDLDIVWKKERTELQKQLQQSQELIEDLQTQLTQRDQPAHLTEKLNVLITENDLLMSKIKELELVMDNVQLLKNEIQRLRDKNSSDWNYWRKQQSDLYAQLRQQTNLKEAVLYKFERLEKQVKSGEKETNSRLVRDLSVGPISLNSFQNEATTKTSLSNFSREMLPDDIDLPHGTMDGRNVGTGEIVGTIDDSFSLSMGNYPDPEKQRMFEKTYSAQENTAASIEEIANKIDRVEDHLFSYRRFMDFIRARSEKSASLVRDDSFTKIPSSSTTNNKRLGSLPPETNTLTASQRRSRFDANPASSQDSFRSVDDYQSTALMSTSMNAAIETEIGSSKNRFFSLSRRFRFRTQSPEKNETQPTATVHFLDQDIDLETKEPTTRRSEQRPSKGILKSLRHRSPFRFRSKDAVIIEQEPSPPPATIEPITSTSAPSSKETQKKPVSVAPTKVRGRLVELKKVTPKNSSTSNGSSRKTVSSPSTNESSGSTLFRRASGLKDLIHKFEPTPTTDRNSKTKRVTIETNDGESVTNEERNVQKSPPSPRATTEHIQDSQQNRTGLLTTVNKSKTADIPDLLRNVEKEPVTSSRPILKHSNSSRQTTSFDSTTSMVSASDSVITTNSTTRRPTSTARPLMLSISKEES